MNDKNGKFDGEVPPRRMPEATNGSGGDLITMYQAQQSGGDSFPVLQAFQEYIDAERRQARRRVVQLTIGFAAILGVVVVGFLFAGVSMLKNMTDMQNKLVEVVADRGHAPQFTSASQPAASAPAVQSSTALEESLREMSRAMIRMQEETLKSRKKTGASEDERAVASVASQPRQEPTRSAVSDPAVIELKAELAAIKEQNRKVEELLRKEQGPTSSTEKISKGHSKVVEEALALARKAAADREAAERIKAERLAAEVAQRRAAKERKDQALQAEERALALRMAAEHAEMEREKQVKRKSENSSGKPSIADAEAVVESRNTSNNLSGKVGAAGSLPTPTKKAPAVVRAGVVAPHPPQNMRAGVLTLKMKNGGELPWRIFVPK
jgi:hypothetical protein